MVIDPRVEALARYRLEEDLSFESLAARMQAAGFPLRTRSLHQNITGRLRYGPRDRTLFKLGRFVELATAQRAAAAKRTRARRKKVKATSAPTKKLKRRAAA
jgi:hypothetical protein